VVVEFQESIRFEFISHKLSRLAVPFALVALLAASIFLPEPLYRAALIVQVAFYVLSILAIVGVKIGPLSRVADAARTFVVLNSAALVAFVSGPRTAFLPVTKLTNATSAAEFQDHKRPRRIGDSRQRTDLHSHVRQYAEDIERNLHDQGSAIKAAPAEKWKRQQRNQPQTVRLKRESLWLINSKRMGFLEFNNHGASCKS